MLKVLILRKMYSNQLNIMNITFFFSISIIFEFVKKYNMKLGYNTLIFRYYQILKCISLFVLLQIIYQPK